MSRPQVIDDQEHERVHERVAAIDVAKDTGMVCTRMPHPSRPGARRAAVWTVKARMNAIRALGRQLRKDGIEIVTLESTSDYWRIWFFVLEACGLAVQLVQRGPGQEPARPAQDRQAGCDVAGPADRDGPAARLGSCRPRRSGTCGITPGPGPGWSTSAPAAGSGWKSCWRARWSRCRPWPAS